MAMPHSDFDHYKMPDSLNPNPEGSTSTAEEKKEVPFGGTHDIKMEYNFMSIQLNINTVHDLHIFQGPPPDASPLYHSVNRSTTPIPGPPPPPGGPSRPGSTEPPKKASPSTGPLGSTRPVDINLSIRQPPGIVGYSQGNKPILVTPPPPPIAQSGRLTSYENKSPMDGPPESTRTTSTDSKESIEETSGHRESPPPTIESRLHGLPGPPPPPGLPPPPGGLSHSPARPPSMPTIGTPVIGAPSIHMKKVVYKQLPGIDDILYEKSPTK